MKREIVLLCLIFITLSAWTQEVDAKSKLHVKKCNVSTVDKDGLEIECKMKRRLESFYYLAKKVRVIIVNYKVQGQVQIILSKRGVVVENIEESGASYVIPESDLREIEEFMIVEDQRQ